MGTYSAPPRVVVVSRATEYQDLLMRHGTRAQAGFFLKTRGQSIDDVESRHRVHHAALDEVMRAIPSDWRHAKVDRAALSRFVFERTDLIVAVGQDGLVANVAKYVDAQLVIGINPDPARWDGVLVQHSVDALERLLADVFSGSYTFEERAMVRAKLSDGQELTALNEIFIGARTHQSARYVITIGEEHERQSSSGLIIATGTGATGWARSIARQRRDCVALPTSPIDRSLVYFVREAFPSVSTACGMTQGALRGEETLTIRSEMNDQGVLFGDGIEDDRIALPFGTEVTISLAPRALRLLPRARVPMHRLTRAERLTARRARA